MGMSSAVFWLALLTEQEARRFDLEWRKHDDLGRETVTGNCMSVLGWFRNWEGVMERRKFEVAAIDMFEAR